MIRLIFKILNQIRQKKEEDFVFVESDGKVRELNSEEIIYLKEEFHPNDDARPYIKTSYSQLTPDGKISGFIKRNRIPKNISIKK